MSSLWLFLKNLLFTALVAGLLIGWVPLHWFERHPHWPERWTLLPGLAVVVFGLGALGYLSSQLTLAIRGRGTPAPFDPPRKFVRRGLYKWLRNPMYLAVLVMVGAEALFLRSWHIAIYFVCLACVLQLLVVLVEENALRFRFGAMYEDYRRDVSRWLPRPPKPLPQTAPPFEVATKPERRGRK